MFSIFSMFSVFSIFSMFFLFSQLTPYSRIRDSRMEQYAQPCRVGCLGINQSPSCLLNFMFDEMVKARDFATFDVNPGAEYRPHWFRPLSAVWCCGNF